jgi:hypothetical protein
MRVLSLFFALICAFGASATTLTHTLQTGHKTSTYTGWEHQTSALAAVEVVETGDADTFTIGAGCADCWEVDNTASGGSHQTTTTLINSVADTAHAGGQSSDYCNTSIAVGALYSAQNKEQGSGWAESVTDASYSGTVDRTLYEWGTSGNGGAEAGSYTLEETEHVDLLGAQQISTSEVFDFTILTSIVE